MERRLRQQEVVAELGQHALETDDLDELMRRACVAVAETLDNEYCKVLELLSGGDAVFLREGVGWQDGLVGSATVPTDRDSQAGYTLITEEPVIVDDLRTEERFSGPELLTNHDVVSGISVIIGSIEDPWGVFGTHTTDRREFSEYDAAFVQTVANVLASAVERHNREQELERSNQRTDLALSVTNATVWVWDYETDTVTTHPDPHGLFDRQIRSSDEFRASIHPADIDQLVDGLESAIETGHPFQAEYRYIVDGEVRWAEDYGEIIEPTGADGPRMIGVMYDITERKKQQEALERSLELLEHTEKIADVGSWEIDPETMDVFWSDQLFEILGVTGDEEPPLEEALDVYHEADRQRVATAVERALDSGEPIDVEVRFVTPGGEVRWLHVQGQPEVDGDEVVSLRGAAQDITDRKERDREVKRLLDLMQHTERIADVGGWEIDVESKDVFWTDHIFGMLNVPDTENPSLDMALEMYLDPDQQRVEEAIERSMTTGDPIDIEARIRTWDGERRWLHLQGESELDNGEVTTLRGAAHDITERKEREHELQRIREWMEFALEATDSVVWTWDVEADEATFYPDEESLYGRSVESLAGFREVIHPDDRADVEEALRRSLETGDPKHEEVRFLRDGEVRWLEAPGKPVEDADGRTLMIGIARDVTERVEREQEIFRLLDLLRHTEHTANVGSWELDATSMELFWSDQLLEIVGISDAEEVPSFEQVLESVHYDDQAVAKESVDAALDGEPFDIEIRIMTPVGGERWLRLQGAPEVDDGQVVRLRGAAQDITDRKAREQALEASHQRLEEFASAVSHDLREPLSTVASYLQLLERRFEEDIDEDAEQFIDFAVDGASRMQEMIDGLVSTYAEVGTQRDAREPVDLDAVVDDVLIDLRQRIEETGAEVTTEPLPEVEGVRGQLRQLFMNLVDNAIKYAGDEPPHVNIVAESTEDVHRIEVRDRGIGIAPSETDEVFEVFSRLHPEGDYPGTGIGLALCQRIVEHHGGEIWVESQLGEGSTFVFTLPATE